MNKEKTVLVTGATGYVGSRLIPRLLAKGYRVKAVARSQNKLQNRSWAKHESIELIEANLLDYQAVEKVLQGCDIAYYLIHSMNPQNKDFELADRKTAFNMIKAADKNSLSRIIYLSGLGEQDDSLSKHLKSRTEVAKILQSGRTLVTVFRAAMIIGSGSASFEILRYLVERLPIMITPRWLNTPSQPIAIRNVLTYLIECLEMEQTIGQTFDIGGPQALTYLELMKIYAQEAGITQRLIIPVPIFTPGLSSYWIHFVTPVPAYIARPLAEGLRNPMLCQENTITKLIPQDLLSTGEAIKLALSKIQHHEVESHWTDAGLIGPAEWYNQGDPYWAGGTVYSDRRSLLVKTDTKHLWSAIISLGGQKGWYWGNWLWHIRGVIDRLLGGVGLQRGRRDPHKLFPGDCLDFWRVKEIIPQNKLLLIAEMKLPGEALLEFQLKTIDDTTTEIIQIARFLPKGLAGIIYWRAISPFHNAIFNGMLNGIATAGGGNDGSHTK